MWLSLCPEFGPDVTECLSEALPVELSGFVMRVFGWPSSVTCLGMKRSVEVSRDNCRAGTHKIVPDLRSLMEKGCEIALIEGAISP